MNGSIVVVLIIALAALALAWLAFSAVCGLGSGTAADRLPEGRERIGFGVRPA
jgi:hypothetical protein